MTRMRVLPFLVVVAMATLAVGQPGPPSFRSEDVRPHGAEDPHPLVPGMLVWIFGSNLARFPGCSAESVMDPSTYQTDLCGTRVLVGGLEARLIFVSGGQINLVVPQHPWEDRMVDFQVIRDGSASTVVPVRFGFNRPVLSLAAPAYAGMPVWIRVEKPWGTGWLRYPTQTQPWVIGCFEVRRGIEELKPFLPGCGGFSGMQVGLPHQPAEKYLHRVPLHLGYKLDRPGDYQIRYTEYRYDPKRRTEVPVQVSSWTTISVLASSAEQRRVWLRQLAENPPEDEVQLLADYLPSLLAQRDEMILRFVAKYLEHPNPLVQQYVENSLAYFEAELVRRLIPGRQPWRLIVR